MLVVTNPASQMLLLDSLLVHQMRKLKWFAWTVNVLYYFLLCLFDVVEVSHSFSSWVVKVAELARCVVKECVDVLIAPRFYLTNHKWSNFKVTSH